MKNTIALLSFIVLGLVSTAPAQAAFLAADFAERIECKGTSEPVKSQFPPQDTVTPADESSS